jgi:hypothetical protein
MIDKPVSREIAAELTPFRRANHRRSDRHRQGHQDRGPSVRILLALVAPPTGAQTHYIWKINRIDGSLYLCQTTTATVKCNQVAGPSGETGPFSLSDAVAENGAAGFHVWRLNRWTGTQELCVSATGQKGCSR